MKLDKDFSRYWIEAKYYEKVGFLFSWQEKNNISQKHQRKNWTPHPLSPCSCLPLLFLACFCDCNRKTEQKPSVGSFETDRKNTEGWVSERRAEDQACWDMQSRLPGRRQCYSWIWIEIVETHINGQNYPVRLCSLQSLTARYMMWSMSDLFRR